MTCRTPACKFQKSVSRIWNFTTLKKKHIYKLTWAWGAGFHSTIPSWIETKFVLTSTSASTWCSIIGLFPNSTSGFGTLRVKGRSLVPYPPTKMRAFIVFAVSTDVDSWTEQVTHFIMTELFPSTIIKKSHILDVFCPISSIFIHIFLKLDATHRKYDKK